VMAESPLSRTINARLIPALIRCKYCAFAKRIALVSALSHCWTLPILVENRLPRLTTSRGEANTAKTKCPKQNPQCLVAFHAWT
jgi:hypothetical protein